MRPTRTVAARICCSASVRIATDAEAAASEGEATAGSPASSGHGCCSVPSAARAAWWRRSFGGWSSRAVFSDGRRQICRSFPPPLIAPSPPALLVLGGPWSSDLVRLGCGSGGSPGEILGRCGPATTVTTSTVAVPLPRGSVEVLFPSPPLGPGENLILFYGTAAALSAFSFLEVPLRWFERCEGVLNWGFGD